MTVFIVLIKLNKELNRQSFKSNHHNNSINSEMSTSKVTTPTSNSALNNQPPWMVELKKTQAEKKNEGKMKKNLSLGDENSITNSSITSSATAAAANTSSTSTFNGTSPNSSNSKSFQLPNLASSVSSSTKNALVSSSHRMSGDYSNRFKDFLQQQNTSSTNSLSRHSSNVNNNNHTSSFNNSSRTLSTDSLDCKEQQQSSLLGFGNLASPFSSSSIVKPVKAAKPIGTKFMSGISPTSPSINATSSMTTNNLLSSNNLNNSSNQTMTATTIQTKDTVSRKEFDELQRKVILISIANF